MKLKISHSLNKLPVIDYRKLKDFQNNLKDLTEKNYKKLLKSFAEFGFFVPLFVWREGKEFYIADGHQRNRVLTKENLMPYELPYIEIEAKNKQEAKRKLLAISSQYGSITQEGYDEFVFDIDESWLKETVHFDGLKDWDVIDATDDDFEPPPLEEIKTDIKLGDLFELTDGKLTHRLICADSTKAENVEKLLDGNCPILMVTDPPYGVNYDADWRNRADRANGKPNGGRAIGKVTNDNNARWLDAYLLFPGNVIYIWCASQRSAEVHQDIIDAGFIPDYQIIWNKDGFVIGRGDYHWKHEPCWYAHRKSKKHNWQKSRSETTVWDIPRPKKNDTGHSTQKPIECMARPIRNNSAEGESVYDPFLGSGTTLLAAHSLGRRCFGCEIEPRYVQICIDRMKKSFPNIAIKKL